MYDLEVAQKMRTMLAGLSGVSERKMFGGIAFMLNGNLACGVHGECLIVRVGPGRQAAALEQAHTRPFDLSGKPMSGWVYVDPQGFASEQELKKWIQWGIGFALSLPGK
jgi:hypothetical protein